MPPVGRELYEEATDTRAVIEINSIPALSALQFRPCSATVKKT